MNRFAKLEYENVENKQLHQQLALIVTAMFSQTSNLFQTNGEGIDELCNDTEMK